MIRNCKNYLPFLILFPIGFALILFGKFVPSFPDFYYKHVYSKIAVFLGSITGTLPFSLSEIIIVISVLFAVSVLIKAVYDIAKKKDKVKYTVCKSLLTILSLLSVMFFLFSVFCGVNYYKSSFSKLCGLKIEKSSDEQLYNLCCSLAERANELSEKLEHDENGVTVLPWSFNETSKKSSELFKKLYDKYPFLSITDSDTFGRPKPVMLSDGMSYLLISGFYSPFTVESNICTNTRDFMLGATMMHEISHLYGFMNESEANFISYLACINSGDVYFEYSGTCLAIIHCGNALYSSDYELWKQFVSLYGDFLINDIKSQNDYVKSHTGTVSEVSDKVNDTYLKLNSVSDGVKSYGKMVDLMLAYYKTLQ